MSYILGLGGYSHDASAALLCDGRLVAAVQEERLTRIKHVGGFPYESIRFCLKEACLRKEDIAAIAFYSKKSNWDGFLYRLLQQSVRHLPYTLSHSLGFVHSVGYRVQKSLNFRADCARFFFETGFSKKIFHDYDHHACHAASSFYGSPFDRAIILCVDGGGDGKTTSGWIGENNRIREIDLGIRAPHSLGLLYTRITRFLGFPSSGDEYKMMGLSAYGKPAYLEQMSKLIHIRNGGYRLNMDYFNYQYEYSFSDRFYKEFGPPRRKDDPITEHYANLAASAQKLFENVLLHLAISLKKRTGIRDLAVSGGSSLNCKGNGALLFSGEFDRIFVPSAASDIGTSIGAAQYHYHHIMGKPRSFVLKTDDWGPSYNDDEILEELQRSGIAYRKVDDPSHTAAELLARGKIVGWFQGGMEFGPRALGHRSILADPRKEDIKDRVNKTIKFREEFRPFAPSCLRERVAEYFNCDIDDPFMTFTVNILPHQRTKVPGIVHVDGSCRLQSVAKEDQPVFHELISKFQELTGVPIVLNTSFNLAGEPIVCSPHDALRTFFTCGMDALVIGNFLITKGNKNAAGIESAA